MRPTGNHLTGYLAVCAAGTLIGTSLAVGAGASATRPKLADVGAWLASGPKGEVVHAHGLTGEVDGKATLPAGTAGHPVSVAQGGRTTLVLDERTGRVVRIDAAQLTTAQSTDYGAAGLQLVSGGAYAYVVDPARGTVQRIDPALTKAESPPVPLDGKPGAAVVDGEGTLWVPLPESGTVVPFVEGLKGAAFKVADPGHDLTLTVAGGRPVVTDGTAATAKVLSATGVRGAFALGGAFAGADPADVLVPSGTEGSAVPVLAARTGDLVVVDVHSRHTVRFRVPTDGHVLGAPQLLGTRVYLPDESTGRLLVYDTAASALAEPIPITDGPGELQLFVQDDLLWVNDPDGAAAAVIDADGEVRRIGKYGTQVPSAREPGDEPVENGVPTGAPAGQVPPGAVVPGATAPGPGAPSVGASGAPSAGASGPPGPTTPAPEPGAPGAPQAESRSGAIRITFAEALGATPQRYVLKGAAPDQTVTPDEVGPDGPFVFEVRGGSCEKQYSFTVVAEYGGGRPDKESARSAFARPCVAPGAPQQLTATPAQRGHGGTVTWQAPQGGGSVTYTVSGPDGTTKTTEAAYTYRNLKNSRSYPVSVTASNAAGSGPATYGTLDLTPPSQQMRIVNNSANNTPIGIRSLPTTVGSGRPGEIPGNGDGQQGIQVTTVHCKVEGQEQSYGGEKTKIWAYHTFHHPGIDKDITGYTTDHFVNSRSNPDVWECE
ncbi:fibronectin type III domain-containing protein [Streptomyces sp. NPDC057740]|uniref:YncE family protein n=1 Tax=Streptomyces sp. NPDC057740 TaxID=3346234 RepID=UPI0036C2B17E